MPRQSDQKKSLFLFKLHVYVVVICLVIISLSQGLKLNTRSPPEEDDPSIRAPHLQTRERNDQDESDDKVDAWLQKHQHRLKDQQPAPYEQRQSTTLRERIDQDDSDDKVDVWLQKHQHRLKDQQPAPHEQRQSTTLEQEKVTGKQRMGAIHMYQQGAGQGSLERLQPGRGLIKMQRRRQNRIMYFVHIHKSAGSLMCLMAYRNRISATHDKNCNVQKDQRCCGGQDTPLAQIEFANTTHLEFVATEREMYESMAPDYYDYIATIRDSKARYFSHWSHLRRLIPVGGEQFGGYGTSQWLIGPFSSKRENFEAGAKESKFLLKKGQDPLGNFTKWLEGQPDNWNTRIFCGPKCRYRPKFQISRELFNETLHRLAQFQHVVFVEDMENSYNQFAQYYGWANYTQDAKKNVRMDKKKGELALKQQEWDPIMSALDDALYEFCRRKFHKDIQHLWDPFSNQAGVDQYFAEGPGHGCRNGCCGNCSTYR